MFIASMGVSVSMLMAESFSRISSACMSDEAHLIGRLLLYGGRFRRAGLELFQDCSCPCDELVGKTGELCNLYAVAVVRRAGDDFAQEDHLALPLFDGDVEVSDLGDLLLHGGQFMIVRGKERLRAELFGVDRVL